MTRYGLVTAVKKIIQGALGHAFMPSPPELRIQCDKAMEWHREQATQALRRKRENEEFERQGLGKPIIRTEEERERVRRRYEQFCAKWAKDNAPDEAERAEIRVRYGMTDEVLAGVRDRTDPADRTKKSA